MTHQLSQMVQVTMYSKMTHEEKAGEGHTHKYTYQCWIRWVATTLCPHQIQRSDLVSSILHHHITTIARPIGSAGKRRGPGHHLNLHSPHFPSILPITRVPPLPAPSSPSLHNRHLHCEVFHTAGTGDGRCHSTPVRVRSSHAPRNVGGGGGAIHEVIVQGGGAPHPLPQQGVWSRTVSVDFLVGL